MSTLTTKDISDPPWERCNWSGELLGLDSCPNDDFTEDDVSEVLAWKSTDDEWDGLSAGLVRLKDERYAAWESFYGPTGSGFCYDAYGGDADIVLARSPEAAVAALSQQAQELLDWKAE